MIKKRNIYIFVYILLVMSVICFALFFYLEQVYANKELVTIKTIAYEENSSDELISENTVESVSRSSNASVKAESKNVVDVNKTTKPVVDIKALQVSNPDIFAWITIPGTTIDYPIVQHPTDDTYYLKHGANGMKSSYGCPFIELDDSKDLSDFNTVVYGHNMNDGSMFAGLHLFENKDFLNKHRTVNVYTSDHSYLYTIFAAVMYSDARIPYYYDDNIAADRTDFLESLKVDIVAKRSILTNDIDVDKNDHIITLSTCDKKLRNKRFLVVAVLTQIDGKDVG